MKQTTRKSPFKVLDPFDKNEREFFFGRDKEVDLLYDFVSKNRIVLLYGQSGTGKTSIIQCGLANEFDVTDWLPFFIRRRDDINASLEKCLNSYANAATRSNGHQTMPAPAPTPGEVQPAPEREEVMDLAVKVKQQVTRIVERMKQITRISLRPIYIIFDQFEEFLILATPEEKSVFIKTVQALLDLNSEIDCHFIIVMREEYFAWLDSFEKDIPGISDRRLRIEPMRPKEIQSVIVKSCDKFNITLENPEENTAQMVRALSKKGEVLLPYLQVYLDQLWKIDYERTYDQGYQGTEEYVPLEFTGDEIKEFGEIKDVLQRFLLDRKGRLEEELKKTHPDIAAGAFISSFLDSFVNDQGTKNPAAFTVEEGFYKFRKKSAKFLRETDPQLLKDTLDYFASSQILRNSGDTFELAHDVLARLIYQQRDAKIKKLTGIKFQIANYTKSRETIPYQSVKNWEKYVDGLDLKPEEKAFFASSKVAGQKQEYDDFLRSRKMQLSSNLVKASLLIIGLLIAGVIWAFRVANSYYAIDFISSIDTISNKLDAVRLARYVYDYKGYDKERRDKIEKKIVDLFATPAVQASFGIYQAQLNAAAKLLPAYEADISGDAGFVVIRNDSLNNGQGSADFSVFNTKQKTVVKTFKKIDYAYFINHGHTAVLALNDSSGLGLSAKLILYNCDTRHTDTIALNDGKHSNRLSCLYVKEFLSRNDWTDYDSYRIRYTASGNLVIPYRQYNRNGWREDRRVRLLGPDKKTVLLDTSSYSSISLSKRYKELIIANTKNGRINVGLFSESGKPEVSFNGSGFADFSQSDTIIYANTDTLVFLTRDLLPQVTMPFHAGIFYAYAADVPGGQTVLIRGYNDTIVAGSYHDGAFYQQTIYDEAIRGFNLKKQLLVTQPVITVAGTGNDSAVVCRNFSGQKINTFTSLYGIESMRYNDTGGDVLVMANKDARSGFQYLYLLSDSLKKKATFVLTPNDCYGFSNNGKNIYYVRDNMLAVFANERLINVDNFEEVNSWLSGRKDIYDPDSKAFKDLRKRYNLKFPW
ncbi:ATP-binding protein [Deminuibacter soli]|uniref:ATP-binding protein n=1 Tax=Deminuibacter soli TaxID=2291815 RepID=A0A3E1NH38_9BACT|nr:ATP-binding protein [Deminuibacter soli]RFM27259.1 ATP-binding protein [Deminuibacter soli]